MNKKNVKKGLLFVLCMALVSVVSIVGTMAVLSKTSNSVVNTFVATQTLTDGLTLSEDEGDNTVGMTFSGLVPKQVVTKDPTFTVNKVYAESYLFVEIVEANNKVVDSGDPGTKFYTYAIADGWSQLVDGESNPIEGDQGGKVWYRTLAISDVTNATYQVLADNQVTIADYTENKAPQNVTMSIYGYMIQTSSYANAAAAYAYFTA